MIKTKNKEKPKVAFQGEKGAYSEEAAEKFFGENIKTLPCESFLDVFKKTDKGVCDYGILPIENSLEGTIGQVYDFLLKSSLKIYGEEILKISHCLIGFPNVKLSQIKEVYSHPQALGQCREFLEKMKVKVFSAYDTAGSVKFIKEKRLKKAAAIASERAALIYKMKVLKKGIETNPRNFTRFVIVSKRKSPSLENMKTSIVFKLKNIPGALFKVLKIFQEKGINLSKIESRPIIGEPWQYNFYLDFEGGGNDEKIKQALNLLKKETLFLKILGSYPKADFNSQF